MTTDPSRTPTRKPIARALSVEQMGALLDAVLDNAKQMLIASQRLLEERYFPQAYSLAHLALEESAKASILMSYWLLSNIGFQLDWPFFWKAWRRHDMKSQIAVFYGISNNLRGKYLTPEEEAEPLREPTPDEVTKAFQRLPGVVNDLKTDFLARQGASALLHERRLSATYVDFHDGQILRPSDYITDAHVREIHAFCESLLKQLQELWSSHDLVAQIGTNLGPHILALVRQELAGIAEDAGS